MRLVILGTIERPQQQGLFLQALLLAADDEVVKLSTLRSNGERMTVTGTDFDVEFLTEGRALVTTVIDDRTETAIERIQEAVRTVTGNQALPITLETMLPEVSSMEGEGYRLTCLGFCSRSRTTFGVFLVQRPDLARPPLLDAFAQGMIKGRAYEYQRGNAVLLLVKEMDSIYLTNTMSAANMLMYLRRILLPNVVLHIDKRH